MHTSLEEWNPTLWAKDPISMIRGKRGNSILPYFDTEAQCVEGGKCKFFHRLYSVRQEYVDNWGLVVLIIVLLNLRNLAKGRN